MQYSKSELNALCSGVQYCWSVTRSDAILSGRHMWLAVFVKYSTVGLSILSVNGFGPLPWIVFSRFIRLLHSKLNPRQHAGQPHRFAYSASVRGAKWTQQSLEERKWSNKKLYLEIESSLWNATDFDRILHVAFLTWNHRWLLTSDVVRWENCHLTKWAV